MADGTEFFEKEIDADWQSVVGTFVGRSEELLCKLIYDDSSKLIVSMRVDWNYYVNSVWSCAVNFSDVHIVFKVQSSDVA